MIDFIISFFETLAANIRFSDFLDITITSVVLYFALLWFKQRSSRAVLIGLSLILLIYLLTRRFDLYLTSLIYPAGLTAIVVALVLIFQQDIRRAFERIATWSIFQSNSQGLMQSEVIDIMVEAIAKMAEKKMGVLIVLRGREPIEPFIRGGIQLNGQISFPLLLSLFDSRTPGHDGAILMDGSKIERFGVHLPLSKNLKEVGAAGTRHTAALGLSERCDAVIIVVSEERGTITLGKRGKLIPIDTAPNLKERLELFMKQISPEGSAPSKTRFLTKNLKLKIFALILSSILWLLFAYRPQSLQRTFEVPIEYRNLPDSIFIEDSRPSEARVTLSGLEREFDFNPSSLLISVNLSGIEKGPQDIYITESNINIPSGMSLANINPQIIRVVGEEMVSTQLPVEVTLTGKLPPNVDLVGAETNPSIVSVLISHEMLGNVHKIRTEPVDLSEVKKDRSGELNLILPEYIRIPGKSPKTVRYSIKVTGR